MDMEELLDSLYGLTVENDEGHCAQVRRAAATAEPQYQRLCAAMGDKAAEEIWDAVMDMSSSDKEFIFRAGLRLGLRLMALCL